MADETTKVYPGNLDRYQAIRKAREEAEANAGLNAHVVQLAILENLEGIAYILDGIRYNTRGGAR